MAERSVKAIKERWDKLHPIIQERCGEFYLYLAEYEVGPFNAACLREDRDVAFLKAYAGVNSDIHYLMKRVEGLTKQIQKLQEGDKGNGKRD